VPLLGDPRRAIIYAIVFIMLVFAVAEVFGVSALNAAWGSFLGGTLATVILASRSEKEEEVDDIDGAKRVREPGRPGGTTAPKVKPRRAPRVGNDRSGGVHDLERVQLRPA
jgi:hypothetical protein